MNNGGSAAAVRGARLKRTLSGMLFATTRGASVAASFESGAALLQRWATAKGFATENELKKKLAYTAVTYIMTTTGEGRDTGMFLDLADTPEFDAVTVVIRVLPKRMTDYIDDKRIFGRLAKQAGVEGANSAVPRTFESVADAVKVLGADPAASKHVFIKDTYGSCGTGVHVELTKNLKSKDFKLGDHQIIQEGVTNFALFEGRTVKIRAFFIAYRGRLYLSTYWNFHKHVLEFPQGFCRLQSRRGGNRGRFEWAVYQPALLSLCFEGRILEGERRADCHSTGCTASQRVDRGHRSSSYINAAHV